MKRNFVINLCFLLFLNILVKPFWIFGVERSVQNIVGAEEFGIYFSLLNFSLLLNIILDMGITNFNNRNIAQNRNLLDKSLSNLLALRLVLAVVYIAISLIIALCLGYELRQMKILGILVVNQFLQSMTLYLRSNVSGMQMFKTDSMLSVLDRLLMIIFCSILVWGHVTDTPIKIEWFVLTQTAAYFITALVAFLIVFSKTKHFRLNFQMKYFIAFIKQSFPYALLILLMAFYNRIDSVMLERMLPDGKEQAGIYAQAFRILEAASMFAYLFSVLLLPMFARMIKQKQNVEGLCKTAFVLIFVPAIALMSVCLFFNREIMGLMYFEHIETSSIVLAILMIGFVGICITYIFGTLLTSNGSLKYLNIMAACGMVLNIILNFILIPHYGVIGAAISSMITQLATGLCQYIIAFRLFKFNFNLKFTIVTVIFVAVSGVGAYFATMINCNWWVIVCLVLVFCVVVAVLLRVLDLRLALVMIKDSISKKKEQQ